MTSLFTSLNKYVLSRPRQVALALVGLVGVAARLVHLWLIDIRYPFYLGGLYLEFAQQIRLHGYRLPHTIPYYSAGGIPFAYPPLSFYIEALLLDITPLAPFVLVNLLPPVISVLAFFSFFYLVIKLCQGPAFEVSALAAFAVLPNLVSEQIAASGLAEALGTLALVWFGIGLLSFYRSGRVLLPGVCLGLCVLASPGSAVAVVPAFAILAGVCLARRRPLLPLVWIGLIGTALAAPYLLTVTANHGSGVFTASLRDETGLSANPSFLGSLLQPLLEFDAVRGPRPLLWLALLWWGLIWAGLTRRWPLALAFLSFYLIPREGVWLAAAPACLLIGLAASETFVPAVQRAIQSHYAPRWGRWIAALGLLALVLVELNSLSILIRDKVANRDKILSPRQVNGLRWIAENTPQDAGLVVLGPTALQEWSPQISRRTVYNVTFGTEWQPAERAQIEHFNQQVAGCRDLACVQEAMAANGWAGQNSYLVVALEGWESSGGETVFKNPAMQVYPLKK